MRRTLICTALTLLFASIALVSNALPVITTQGDANPFVVRTQSVSVEVFNHLIRTTVTQVVYNDGEKDLPCNFDLNLPKGAHASSLEAIIDGKRFIGRIETKKAARKIVDESRAQGKSAALAEENDGVLHVELSLVKAYSEIVFSVSYIEEAAFANGAFQYWFGLAKFNNEMPAPANYSLNVSFNCTAEIKSVSCEHHTLVGGVTGKTAQFSVEDIYLIKRDFHMEYMLDLRPGEMHLMMKDDGTEDPYFCLFGMPPDAPTEDFGRSLIFILDKSGSMQDDNRFGMACEALLQFIEKLRPIDLFNVFIFDLECAYVSPLPFAADDAGKKAAAEFIGRYRAVGGTHFLAPTLNAISQLSLDNTRPASVVLLTDGHGTTPAPEFIARVDAACKFNVPIFVFAIGNDLNAPLLRSLASYSGAAYYQIIKGEDIPRGVEYIRDQLARVTGFKLNVATQDRIGYQRYPQRLSLLYGGEPLIVYGRLDNEEKTVITTSADTSAGQWARSVDISTIGNRVDCPFLDQAWGIRRIGALLDDESIFGVAPVRKNEIITLSRKYLITTPHTSLVLSELSDTEQAQLAQDDLDEIEEENESGRGGRVASRAKKLDSKSGGGRPAAAPSPPSQPAPDPAAMPNDKSKMQDMPEKMESLEKKVAPPVWMNDADELLDYEGNVLPNQIIAHSIFSIGLLSKPNLNDAAKALCAKSLTYLALRTQDGKISNDLLEQLLASYAIQLGKASRTDLVEIAAAMQTVLGKIDTTAALKDATTDYKLAVVWFSARFFDAGFTPPDAYSAPFPAICKSLLNKDFDTLPYGKSIVEIRAWVHQLPIAVGLNGRFGVNVSMDNIETRLNLAMEAREKPSFTKPDFIYWLSWRYIADKGLIKGFGKELTAEMTRDLMGFSAEDANSLFGAALGKRAREMTYMLIN